MRIAVLKKDKCIAPENCNYICLNVCPINRTGKQCIVIGEDKKPIINENLCIGCDICVKRCPAQAISIVNLPQELSSKSIHRYSVNGFKLFKTIIPREGVVGVVGRNGIGKTTMISILSGKLRPNLGKPDYNPTDKEILDFFQGTEARDYVEKLLKKEIKVSFKPQYIELIPKSFKGKVKEMFNELPKSLENIKERRLPELSGGELQRVAIEYALSKDYDIIFIDEPSSYLDIKQRMKYAEKIRNVKKGIVVEHDLIMLDYMSEYLQILYGKPGVYGIVSSIMQTRNGINSYLDGYIKSENVRFRDEKIKFEIKSPNRTHGNEKLISFNNLYKKLGDFELYTKFGEIYKNEIVGIVGENGIGKTTFARIIAGEIKPDKGEIEKKIKISYKPQYIKVEDDRLVSELKLKKELIAKFNININKQLSELSGGELQRVAIANTLSKEADLYLFDEPSAHLDVEERLLLAKILKDFVFKKKKTVMVVDHDILFIDYISDRLIVFDGTPSKKGILHGPTEMREGMNMFLKNLDITMRRDPQTHRPRMNKKNSALDRKQKEIGEYYY